jgi:hypothetical protein
VNIGGTDVNIDSRTQGQSHSVDCPSGYSGTVTGNCPANSNTFSTTHNCLRQCGAGVFQRNVCTPTQYPYEHFTDSGNDYHDLNFKTITFMPCNNNYAHETTYTTTAGLSQATSTGGDRISASDDSCHIRSLSSTFTYFDQNYNSVYFCSNGYLSFTNSNVYSETVSEFADRKYIASIWDDFNPVGHANSADTGMYHQTVGTVDTFRWVYLSQYSEVDSNTFAVQLDSSNGKITIIHGAVHTGDGIVGLSNGQGTSSISEVDFSTSDNCERIYQ